MSDDLAAATWSLVRDRPDGAPSGPARVMQNLATFQADPCASTWYAFVIRLGLLVEGSAVCQLVGPRDPFPVVTARALADAGLANRAAADQESG